MIKSVQLNTTAQGVEVAHLGAAFQKELLQRQVSVVKVHRPGAVDSRAFVSKLKGFGRLRKIEAKRDISGGPIQKTA